VNFKCLPNTEFLCEMLFFYFFFRLEQRHINLGASTMKNQKLHLFAATNRLQQQSNVYITKPFYIYSKN
jgi:hypothetical protein